MYERFTERARKIMQLANQEAQRFNHEYIGTEHILAGLVKEGTGVAFNVLKNLGIDTRKIRPEVEKRLVRGPEMITMGKLPQTPRSKKVIEYSMEESRNLSHNFVGSEHLLLGLLREAEGVAAEVLSGLDVKLDEARKEICSLLGTSDSNHPIRGKRLEKAPRGSKSKTPALDTFGRDLTAEVIEKKVLVTCKDAEVVGLARALARHSRNNAILTGPAGADFESVINGLARRIADRKIPMQLQEQRIVAISIAQVMEGAKSLDKYCDRITAIRNETRRIKNVILVIDLVEWMQYAGRSWEEKSVLVSFVQASFDSGFRIIFTFTEDSVGGDDIGFGAILESGTVVQLSPPGMEKIREFLADKRGHLERHHVVNFSDEAMDYCAKLLETHIGEATTQRLALDIVEEAGLDVAFSQPAPDHSKIDEEIQLLDSRKEAAVTNCDFEAAASFRQQADDLRQKRNKMTDEFWSAANENRVVTRDIIRIAFAKVTGLNLEKLQSGDE